MDKRNNPIKRSFDLPTLIGELESLDVTRRERARRTLAALGSTALPCLTEALEHPAEWVRWEAATTLGMIASPESAEALTAALEDPSPAVRLAAAEALAEIGNPACPVVIDALNKHYESEPVRQGAHRVLQTLALRGKLPRMVKENSGSGRLTAKTGALIVGYRCSLGYSSFRLLQIDNWPDWIKPN